MCRGTGVTGSRVDVAGSLRSVWRNAVPRGNLLRHRQGGANNCKRECEPKHKIDSCFHSYPDSATEIPLDSEETESPRFCDHSNSLSGIRIPPNCELAPSAPTRNAESIGFPVSLEILAVGCGRSC